MLARPVRIFVNPFNDLEIWVTSFGGGLHVFGAPLFQDGFESGDTSAWGSLRL